MGSKQESLSERIRETISSLSDEDLVNMLNAPTRDFTPFAQRVAWEEVTKRKRAKAAQEAPPAFVTDDPGAYREESAGATRADCFIELWSDKNFEGECVRIEGPVECQAFDSSSPEWSDSISSLRVGPSAFVLVYAETDFKGDMMSFGPGQDVADLEALRFNNEIDSIKLINSMKVFDALRVEDAKKAEAAHSPEKQPRKKGRRPRT